MKKDIKNEIKSTSHSKYRCQYHIVFAPKYRRKEIYGTLKKILVKYYGSSANKRMLKSLKQKRVKTTYTCS